MKLALASVFLGLVVLAGCDKPSEGDCRRAIGNIRKLMGTSQMTLADGQDAAWLRSCKGAAKKKSVTCAIKATNTDELKACGLLKGKQLEELEAIDRAVRERAPAPAPTPTPAPTPEPAAPTPTPDPAAPTPTPDPAAPTPTPAAPTPAAPTPAAPAPAPAPSPAPATP